MVELEELELEPLEPVEPVEEPLELLELPVPAGLMATTLSPLTVRTTSEPTLILLRC